MHGPIHIKFDKKKFKGLVNQNKTQKEGRNKWERNEKKTGLKDTKHLVGIKSGLEAHEIIALEGYNTCLEGYRSRPGIL